jgi:hypothetical protein
VTTDEEEVAVEHSVNECVGVLVPALVVSSTTLLIQARAGGQG